MAHSLAVTTAAVVLVLLSLCLQQAAADAAIQPTHNCTLYIDGRTKLVQLSCERHDSAPSSCQPVVYYNTNYTQALDLSWQYNGASMLAKPMPPVVGHNDQFNDPLNRTTVRAVEVNGTINKEHGVLLPLLQFFGDPSCYITLQNTTIQHFRLGLGGSFGNMTQVLMVNGGLKAELNGGRISDNQADMLLTATNGSLLAIEHIKFANNSVGGGVLHGSWSSHVRVFDTEFVSNYGMAGAGIFLGHARTAVIKRSVFANNSAGFFGVAIAAYGSHLQVTNSSFSSNGPNGACFLHNTRATFLGTNFTNNLASGGGALFCAGERGNLTVSQGWLKGNSAAGGGAITLLDGWTATINMTHFVNNTATSAAIRLPEQLLREAVATNIRSGYDAVNGFGGAILYRNSSVIISNSNLTSNNAGLDGGAVRGLLGEISIINSSITNNTALRHGAGVCVGTRTSQGADPVPVFGRYNQSSEANLLVINSRLQFNRAYGNGGGIMLEAGANATITATNITDCLASQGGGIYAETDDDAMTASSKFYNKSLIEIDAKLLDNAASNMVVGPFWHLSFTKPNVVNEFSKGVVWRRKLCRPGEFISNTTQYCTSCATLMFSLDAINNSISNCIRAPSAAKAPGGAVLIPTQEHYQTAPLSENVTALPYCTDCHATANYSDIRRCPNPKACEHDMDELERLHPYNFNLFKHKDPKLQNLPEVSDVRQRWKIYLDQQCAVDEGYTGLLCGVCVKNYGTTSPFNCKKCLTKTSQTSKEKVDITKTLGLYAAYWVFLTLWYVFSVWSSMPGQPSSAQHARPAPVMIDATGDTPTQQDATGDKSTRHKSEAGMLDIIKAHMVYFQWLQMLRSLPIQWLPESLSKVLESSTSTGSKGLSNAWNLLSGRAASLDCLFQGMDILQQETQQGIAKNVILRSLTSSTLIPLVFIVSVTLCFGVWYVARRSLRECKAAQRWPSLIRRHVFSHTQTQAPGELNSREATSEESKRSSTFFGQYLFRCAVAAALVISFEFYSVAASMGLGMLICIGVPSPTSASWPEKYRWVMDVRLQCPARMQYATPWAIGAVMLGIFLLGVCICWPIAIAAVLLRQALAGKLGSQSSGDAEQDSTDRFAQFLAFRYADYSVDCAKLSQAGKSAPNQSKNEGWQLWSMLRQLLSALRQLRSAERAERDPLVREYACLIWDSVLDLQRFVLALLALCVMLHELHQLLLMTVVLGLYLVVIVAVRPWRSTTIWMLQVAAAGVLVLSCCVIMACNIGDTSSRYSPDESSRYLAVLPFVVVGLNAAYVVLGAAVLACCIWRKFWAWCKPEPEAGILQASGQKNGAEQA